MKRMKHDDQIPDAINCSATKDFTQVPNEFLRNPNISGKAKAILCILLSNKEGWKTYFNTLKQMMKERDDALHSGIAELEEYGYLVRLRYRDKQTKQLRGSFWAYVDIPEHLNITVSKNIPLLSQKGLEIFIPRGGNPYKGNPNEGIPDGENPALIRLIGNKTNNNNTNKTSTPPTSWKSLSKEYGQPRVIFVKRFLENQQKNHPKKIQGDISPNHTRVLSSLDCLDKLCRIDGYDFETEVRPVLEEVPADKFWSRNLLSLGALRNSSSNGETKFVNICNTLSSETPSSKPLQTPEHIIEGAFTSITVSKAALRNYFNPAWSLMSHNNNGAHVESELAQNMVDFAHWFKKKQQRPNWRDLDPKDEHQHAIRCKWEDEIPDAWGFMKKYTEWLADQTWLDEIVPLTFSKGSRIMQRFIQHHQKQIGLNIFTGERR